MDIKLGKDLAAQKFELFPTPFGGYPYFHMCPDGPNMECGIFVLTFGPTVFIKKLDLELTPAYFTWEKKKWSDTVMRKALAAGTNIHRFDPVPNLDWVNTSGVHSYHFPLPSQGDGLASTSVGPVVYTFRGGVRLRSLVRLAPGSYRGLAIKGPELCSYNQWERFVESSDLKVVQRHVSEWGFRPPSEPISTWMPNLFYVWLGLNANLSPERDPSPLHTGAVLLWVKLNIVFPWQDLDKHLPTGMRFANTVAQLAPFPAWLAFKTQRAVQSELVASRNLEYMGFPQPARMAPGDVSNWLQRSPLTPSGQPTVGPPAVTYNNHYMSPINPGRMLFDQKFHLGITWRVVDVWRGIAEGLPLPAPLSSVRDHTSERNNNPYRICPAIPRIAMPSFPELVTFRAGPGSDLGDNFLLSVPKAFCSRPVTLHGELSGIAQKLNNPNVIPGKEGQPWLSLGKKQYQYVIIRDSSHIVVLLNIADVEGLASLATTTPSEVENLHRSAQFMYDAALRNMSAEDRRRQRPTIPAHRTVQKYSPS